jgi:hypothetical protein
MNKYICNDGNAELEITADSPRAAAQEYVDGGDWGSSEKTTWVNVTVTPIDEDGEVAGEDEHIKIELNPDEPECDGDHEHEWRSPHSVVGGLRENPGVQSHGGGAVITEVCAHCAHYKVTNTWAQDPEDGQQGLTSIEYRDADDDSRAWVNARRKSAVMAAIEAADLVDMVTLDDDDRITISVHESGSDRALEALRRELPDWAGADFTGNSTTHGDSDTADDIRVGWETI